MLATIVTVNGKGFSFGADIASFGVKEIAGYYIQDIEDEDEEED